MVYTEIAAKIKRSLLAGECADGRLPNRVQLGKCHGATAATIQNAVDLLARQGLVKASGRNGTYLRDDLERSLTIGVAIQAAETREDSLFSALVLAAADLAARNGCKFKFYYGILDAPELGDTAALLKDIDGHVLGGLILFWPSRAMFQRFSRPWLPLVCSIEDRYFDACDYVAFDYRSLVDKMLDVCQGAGRRRPALFVNMEMKREYLDYFLAESRRRGLETREEWIQAGCLCHRDLPWAAKTVALMLARNWGEPPDALLVFNEQLASHAVAGVAMAGLRSPEDLLLVSHRNFPGSGCDVPAGCVWVGFDICAFLEACVGVICQRFGGAVGERTVLFLEARDESCGLTRH